jgi:predicted ATPase
MRGDSILEKIQIKNMRSLSDTGLISLSPITLLVGENSSGKSTFLRTFPLIKQSICKRTDGPLLWAGDIDDYVDFGSFSETVTNDGSDEIVFRFKFSTKFKANSNRQPDHIDYSITIVSQDNREYVSKVCIYLNQTKFDFILDPTSSSNEIRIDEVSVFKSEKRKEELIFGVEDILLRDKKSIFDFDISFIRKEISLIFEEFIEKHINFPYVYVISVLSLIGQGLCKNMSLEEISKIKPKDAKSRDIILPILENIIKKLNDMEPLQKEQFVLRFKLKFFYEIFSQIEAYLETYFRNVHYIAPLRATAERYYRLRNLAIDEVDYQGKNMAIFLNSMLPNRLKKFQEWTLKYFGFKVVVNKNEGHLSIKIALQSDENAVNLVNLSDTGFGYSQILPIITQLWDLSTSRKTFKQKEVPLVIAIEQPELHLHPSLQAKLSEVFIASIRLAKKHGYKLQLLLETHSETIVNYFGRAIARDNLKSEDISVILFDKDMNTKHTIIQTSKFDKDGYLLNWPIGFFAPRG